MTTICHLCTGNHPTNYCSKARAEVGLPEVSRLERDIIEGPLWNGDVHRREVERVKKARWRANGGADRERPVQARRMAASRAARRAALLR